MRDPVSRGGSPGETAREAWWSLTRVRASAAARASRSARWARRPSTADSGQSQKCTLCDGDPLCVKVCAERALTFADGDEEGLRRKRAALEAYLELVTAPSVAAGGVTHGNGAMTRGNGRPA